MPIYEYICKNCNQEFELIVGSATLPECPSCQKKEIEKQFSSFSVGSRTNSLTSRASAGPCGHCGDPRGPGSCRIQ